MQMAVTASRRRAGTQTGEGHWTGHLGGRSTTGHAGRTFARNLKVVFFFRKIARQSQDILYANLHRKIVLEILRREPHLAMHTASVSQIRHLQCAVERGDFFT